MFPQITMKNDRLQNCLFDQKLEKASGKPSAEAKLAAEMGASFLSREVVTFSFCQSNTITFHHIKAQYLWTTKKKNIF